MKFQFSALTHLFKYDSKFLAIDIFLQILEILIFLYLSNNFIFQFFQIIFIFLMIQSKAVSPSINNSRLSCEAYVEFQKYNLKSNLLSINFSKKDYLIFSNFFISKVSKKYDQINKILHKTIQQTCLQLKVAQGNQLRVLNNILRNYKNRVNLTNHQPIKQFVDRTFEVYEKFLIQQMILGTGIEDQNSFQQKLKEIIKNIQQNVAHGERSLNDIQKIQDTRIMQLPKSIVEVINSCQIHLRKEYEIFQKQILTLNDTLQKGFQNLSQYFDKFQELASVKAYSISTAKQKLFENIIAKHQKKYFQKQDQQSYSNHNYSRYQTQQNYSHFNDSFNLDMTNPYHLTAGSVQQQKLKSYYKKEIENVEYKKLSQNQQVSTTKKIGQMFNKKKGKSGILSKQKSFINLIDEWYYNVDGEETLHTNQNIFIKENTILGHQQLHSQYQNLNYLEERYNQNYKQQHQKRNQQKRFLQNKHQHQSNSIQSILNRIYPSSEDIQSLYNCDKYGSNQNFSLISPFSNFIQRRIQFQCTRQVELQQKFQYDKIQILERQRKAEKYILNQNESSLKQNKSSPKSPKQNKPSPKQTKSLQNQINSLQNVDNEMKPIKTQQKNLKNQSQQLKPGLQAANNQTKQQDIQKSFISSQNKKLTLNKNLNQKKQSTLLVSTILNNSNNYEQNQTQKRQQKIKQITLPYNITLEENNIEEQTYNQVTHISLLSFLIQGYFKNLQVKYSRISKDQRTIKIFYFNNLQTVNWKYIVKYCNQAERIFIILEKPVILLIKIQKFYSLQKQRIKCTVFEFNNDLKQIQKDLLKKNIKTFLFQAYLVSFKFQDINTEKAGIDSKNQIQMKNMQKIRKLQSQFQLKDLDSTKCLLGMLIVLIYEQNIQQTSYEIEDYVQKGKQIIEDYLSFQFDQSDGKGTNGYNYSQFNKLKSRYQNISKINYVFDLENGSGIQFQKISQMIDNQQNNEPLEVFKVKKFKQNGIQQDTQSQKDLIESDQEEALREMLHKQVPVKKINENNQPNQKINLIPYENSSKRMAKSNSRQQLKCIQQSNLILILNEEQRSEYSEEQNQDNQDNQQNSTKVAKQNKNQKTLQLNNKINDKSEQEFQDDDSQQQIGLQ